MYIKFRLFHCAPSLKLNKIMRKKEREKKEWGKER